MSKSDFAEKYLKLKPITKAQKKYAQKNAARNIYIVSKDGSGFCSRCEATVQIKAKHKEMVKCPHCKEKLMIQHTWRMSENQEEFRFLAIPQVLDSETYVIRYVIASRIPQRKDFVMPFRNGRKGTPWWTEEVARIYGCEKYSQPVYYVKAYIWDKGYKKYVDGWKQSRTEWFRPDTYSSLCRNSHWTEYHDIYPRNIYKNLNKLDCFKYYPAENIFDVKSDNVRNLHFCVRTARISEKLDKCGLGFLIKENHDHYWHSSYYYGLTPLFCGNKSIQETLKINNKQMKLLKLHPSRAALNYLQRNSDASEEMYELAATLGFNSKIDNLINKYSLKQGKTYRYVIKTAPKTLVNSFIVDYTDYVNTLVSLDYPLDKQYLYPNDFYKEHDRVHKEYADKQRRIQEQENANVNNAIRKISKTLMQSKRLKLWMGGSQGLKVVVPQSIDELVNEGIRQHNCVATYAKSIADKKCIIFFIRKIEEPDSNYITVEYRDGKIRQIRFDYNNAVEDKKIIAFADHLAEELNKMKIINKLKKMA